MREAASAWPAISRMYSFRAHARARPKRDECALAHSQPAGVLLGHGNGDLGLARIGERDNGLTGAHHLSGLTGDGGDDAGLVGHQRRIADCVGCLQELGLRRLERRRCRVELVLAGVIGCLRDDGFRQQRLGTLQIVVCHLAAGAGRRHRSLCAVLGKLQVGLIEAGYHLADLHPVAHVDRPLDDLAGHAEANGTLDPRPHHAGVGERPAAGRGFHDCDLDRAGDLFVDLGLALTPCEQGSHAENGKADA